MTELENLMQSVLDKLQEWRVDLDASGLASLPGLQTDVTEGLLGNYDYVENIIRIDDSSAAMQLTLIHEMGHWAMHRIDIACRNDLTSVPDPLGYAIRQPERLWNLTSITNCRAKAVAEAMRFLYEKIKSQNNYRACPMWLPDRQLSECLANLFAQTMAYELGNNKVLGQLDNQLKNHKSGASLEHTQGYWPKADFDALQLGTLLKACLPLEA